MQDLWNRDPPENFPNIREVRIGLRNKYQQVIRELQSVLGIYPDRIRPEDCGRLGPIMTRLKVRVMRVSWGLPRVNVLGRRVTPRTAAAWGPSWRVARWAGHEHLGDSLGAPFVFALWADG